MKESIQYTLAEPKGGVVGEPWFPTHESVFRNPDR